ncbi:CarboxypepD_reg-like domain-containing protein [Flavobacterium micromati]|uniref:CarboxypepD_reg-like domain-containing protein n=1 Tax=Flavobacterium micromati TaxID=229205 RepID=A0A1M5L066_9FLAO|nr:carboxypeptidase-like regulatory domain-containing protein [Flavobacterium micromati]SHG58159.1 CarboxypepD_reg-like domain-containing protein [Flavobacterium micromati]
MKNFYVLVFFVYFSMSSQINGTVVDEKNQAIAYVNIWVENENIGTTSNQKGQFFINSTIEKVLIFSAVGFELKKIKIVDKEIVTLQTAIYNLNEVVISKSKGSIEREIGNFKKSITSHLSGSVPWIYAKRFEFNGVYKKTPFLKNAIVFTKSKIKNAKFKLRIFAVQENGFPAEDLLKEDVVVVVKSGKNKNVIDLSKFKLIFPHNGIFLAYEWMIIEENKYLYKTNFKGSSKNYSINYAPAVLVNKVETENTFMYREGRWMSRKGSSMNENSNNVIIEPAINLTLTN